MASNFNLKQFSRVMEYHPQKGISDENKSIDLVNEKTERKELLEWIPMLVKIN